MKKPTLRFRQVFEHPTHFKVTKPLGNPLLIAKKGLSPGLQSRLRKFADGTPDEPVQPPTEQDKQNLDQVFAEMAQTPAEPVGDVLSATRGEMPTGQGLVPSTQQLLPALGFVGEEPPVDFTRSRGVSAAGEGLSTPSRITRASKLPALLKAEGVFAGPQQTTEIGRAHV